MNEDQDYLDEMRSYRKMLEAGMITDSEYIYKVDQLKGRQKNRLKKGGLTRDEMIQKIREAEREKRRLERQLKEEDNEKMRQEEWNKVQKKLNRDEQFRQRKLREKKEIIDDTKILYYAGIGSRSTPDYVLQLMEQLGAKLREDRMVLRTGHAPGADQAFERGAGGVAQIFLPWASFEQDVEFSASRTLDSKGRIKLDAEGKEMVVYPSIYNEPTGLAMQEAAEFHPNWPNLSQGAQKLHARNVHQILGPELARPTPVEFVICWTVDGTATGGTGQAIRIAESMEIPVYNLFHEEHYDMAFEWVWGGNDEL